MRIRPGINLIELMVVVAIIGAVLAVGTFTLRTDENVDTRNAAAEVVELFRNARYAAGRNGQAIVVVAYPYGTVIDEGEGTLTRGRVEAYLTGSWNCPGTRPAGPPYRVADFGSYSGVDTNIEPGLVWVLPDEDGMDLAEDDFCVRPTGRIVNNRTNDPIRPSAVDALDLSGMASLWIQWNPIRLTADGQTLVVPRLEIEVPFSGLVRIVQ